MAKTGKGINDDRVEVSIPRGQANEDPNLLVSINGVNYLLPRGKKSLVPKHVAYEIERAFEAQERLDDTIDRLRAESQQ
jgi:hypothetical protein